MSSPEPTVQWVPIDRITVVNPRSRGKPKFRQITSSIEKLGLKKPITVARREGRDGEPRYDLVCGQGRLEAFQGLGEIEVPAIVIDASKEDLLLMSLAENLARRQFTTIDLAREIVALKDRGYTNAQIAKKTDLHPTYVSGIIRLFKHGEERLIQAVEREIIPLSVAIEIANSDDGGVQRALSEAYEKGELRGKAIIRARQIVEKRRSCGKGLRSGTGKARKDKTVDSKKILDAYRKETTRQRLLVQKGAVCEDRLLFVVTALKQLFDDENFVNLLRAEGLDTLPKYLADRIHGKEV
jgi:ParB family chromosome partitioning protein